MTGDVTGSVPVATRKSVVPYISMRSPGPCAPTLSASVQASMVPATTGVPAGMPQTSDRVVPTGSAGQRSRGSSRCSATRGAHRACQSWVCRSSIGVHWLAEWRSSTYSPVRR